MSVAYCDSSRLRVVTSAAGHSLAFRPMGSRFDTVCSSSVGVSPTSKDACSLLVVAQKAAVSGDPNFEAHQSRGLVPRAEVMLPGPPGG